MLKWVYVTSEKLLCCSCSDAPLVAHHGGMFLTRLMGKDVFSSFQLVAP
jgi:hypothetical protein